MKKRELNLLFTGVGGQGVLSATEIVARIFFLENYDIKASALRGMAQRGGTIISHLRAGEKVFSPLIPYGQVDIIIGFEVTEAAKYVDQLKGDGLIIFAEKKIDTNTKETKSASFLKQSICKSCKRAIPISEQEFKKHLSNEKALNTFILGYLSNFLPFRDNLWHKAISQVVPNNLKKENLEIFRAGKKTVLKYINNGRKS